MASTFSQAMLKVITGNAGRKDDDEEKRRRQESSSSASGSSSRLGSFVTGTPYTGPSGMVNATGTEAQTIQTPVLNAARGNDTKPELPTAATGMVNATGVEDDSEKRFKNAESAYRSANAALQAEAMSGMASAETAAKAEQARQEYLKLKDERDSQKSPERQAVEDFRQKQAELQMAAQSGGATAEQAAKEREAEDTLRDLGIATDQRAGNVLKGAGQRIGAGFTNTLATSVDATALTEAAKNAYDPNLSAVTGGDADKYIQEFRQETHEGIKPVYEAADKMSANATADLEKAKLGLSELGQAGVDIAENMLEMGFDAVVGLATGGGSLGSMFVRTLGTAMQEARQNGATLEQQMAHGLTSAGIEVLTEKLFDGVAHVYGKGAADEITEKLVAKLAKTDTGRTAARLLLGAIGEGGEELISDLLSPVADAMYRTDENGNRLSLKQLYGDRFSADGMSEMLYDFLIGAAVSAIAGGAGGTITGQNARANANLRIQELSDAMSGEQQAAPSQLNTPEATQELSGSEALARTLGGQTEAQSEAQQVGQMPSRTFVPYNDNAAKAAAQNQLHQQMVADGTVVDITDSVDANAEFYPDLRGMKRRDRMSVIKEKVSELKDILRGYLSGLKDVNYDFDVNGDTIEARLYNTGINEVLEKLTKEKAGMVGNSDQIFRTAQYLYSTPDKTGNPNIASWDYFYCPIKIGSDVVGVRIAVRNLEGDLGPESQIYNWGIKKESAAQTQTASTAAPQNTEASQTSVSPAETGHSNPRLSDASTLPIPQNAPTVNTENAGTVRSQSEENTIQALDEQLNAPEEVRNPLYYNPVSEEESMSAARDYLENGYESDMPARISSKLTPEQATTLMETGARLGGGYEKAMSDMQGSAVWTSVQQDMSTMIFDALAKDAAETGNWDAYEAWRIIDQEHGTEIARTLQARGKRTRGIATTLNETAEYIQSLDLSKEARDAVMNKVLPYAEELQGISDTDTDRLKQFITDIAKQRKTGTIIPGMLAKLMKNQDADFLSRLAKASVKSFAADHVPVDIGGKIKSYQTIAQLLKVTTAMRNLGGNETFGFMDALIGNTLGQAIDMAVKGKTGARSVAGDLRWLSSTQRKAMVDAMEKSMLEIALDVDMGSVGTKYDPQRRAFSMSGKPAERFMSRLSQLLSYSLTSSDRFFRGGIEAGTVEGLNRLNAGNEAALAQSEDVAKALADYRLFQNDSKVAQGSKQVHDMLNNLLGVGGQTAKTNPSVPKGQRRGGWGLGDLIMPYATVPANLAVKAFEYSPAGIVKGGVELAKVMKDANNGKLNLKAQNKAVMDIARGTTGVPLAILFASLIKAGIVKRSDDDKDYDVTKARQTEGRRETQWNLDATLRWLNGGGRDWQEGDDLVSLNWMEPINAFMDIGALFADVMDDGDADIADYAGKYVGGAMQAFLEMPMIEGLQNAVQAVQRVDSDNWMEKAGKFAESTATSSVTGMIPGGISQLARTLDPVTRDTSADTATQRIANAMMNALPVLRKQLPEKLDSFAQPVKNENPLLNALNNLALPGVISEYAPDDVVKALDDVYAETGKSNFYPDYKAPNSFSYGKQDYALNTEEKRAWQESFGERYAELVRATINSPQYADMDADTKAKVFSEIRSAAAEEARGVVVTGRGDEFKSDYDSILSLSDIPGYLSTKARFADAVESRDYGEIDSILKAYGKLPKDVVEKLDKGTVTGNLDKLYEATQAGATTENWFKATDATKDLPIPTGKKEVTDAQKWQAMAGAVSDKQADIILKGYMEDGTYDKYMAARKEGVTAKQWTHAMAETSKLIPPEGKDQAPDWQKYEVITKAEPGASDAILKGYLTENQYPRYEAARKAGITPQEWASANAGVAQLQPLQGEKSVKEWQQYEYIVQNHPKEAEALIPYFMNQDGPRERFKTATAIGVSPELYVAYYKQTNLITGKGKKDKLKQWVIDQGYSQKTASYMYDLFNANIKDLPGLNSKYGK